MRKGRIATVKTEMKRLSMRIKEMEEFERECDAARAAETEDLLRREFPGGIPSEF